MAECDDFKEQFESYCTKKGEMTTKDLKTMLDNAKLLDPKEKGMKFSSQSADIAFGAIIGKEAKGKKVLTYAQICHVLEKLCSSKKDKDAALANAYKCLREMQSLAAITQKKTKEMTATNASVKTLCDTSKYTGSHKERFDESGKGKGCAGRSDAVENTGYVGEYKGEDSYGKKN